MRSSRRHDNWVSTRFSPESSCWRRSATSPSIMNAVVFARKNQMDLAVSSVIGAATQIALLVAPALVFASLLLPTPMDLLFSRLELVALVISVLSPGT